MSKRLVSSALALCLLSGLLSAAEDTWDDGCEKIGLSMGGSIFQGSCSPHDPKLLTVATDMGGSFITYDAGEKWHTIPFGQLTGSINASAVFHPKDPNVIYWVGGTELKVSHDKGHTWTHVGQAQPWRAQVIRIWLDPDYPERIFVGTDSSTFLSKDEGKSWSGCTNVTGYLYRVVADRSTPVDKRVYLIGASTGCYRSDDNGATFTKKTQGFLNGKLSGFAGGSNDKGTILYVSTPCALKDGKLTGGMFRSKDRGETWERCMTSGINVETQRGSEYALDDLPQYGWIACADKMPQRAYVFCDGTSYNPPNHATLYRTDNGGESWTHTLFTDPRFNTSYEGWTGTPEMACNVELDWQTETWGQREQGSLRGLEINAANPDMVVLDQERFFYYTLDAGKTWKSPCNGIRCVDANGRKSWATSGEVCTSSWNYYIDPCDKTRHFICYTDICLARSLDSGKTWSPESYKLRDMIPNDWINSCYALAFDPEVPGRVWGAFSAMHDIPNDNALFHGGSMKRRGGIAVSNDHGETWKKVAMPLNGPAMSIVVDPKSPKDKRTLYVSMFERGVMRSDDGGATWAVKTNGLNSSSMRCLNLILHRDGTLFVATTCKGRVSSDGVGIWRSTDKGETWTNMAAGQNWSWIRDFTVKPDDSRTVLVPTTRLDPGLHRTIDGGKTWETIYKNKNQGYFFGATYHPNRKGWIYLSAGESEDGPDSYGLYLSKDDGQTWIPYTKLPFRSIERMAFNPDDPEHILLTTFGSSILKVPVEP